ncbi:hypothetical protein [Streptomyces sp. NBC_00076]|uniref:hypothetical protein n=1 Tax=Streptomyces sp. NBC_00076 TaxID=2975642 RepID=UPI003254162D
MKGLGRLKLALLVPIVAVLTATAAVAASPVSGQQTGQAPAFGEEAASAPLDNTWGP